MTNLRTHYNTENEHLEREYNLWDEFPFGVIHCRLFAIFTILWKINEHLQKLYVILTSEVLIYT